MNTDYKTKYEALSSEYVRLRAACRDVIAEAKRADDDTATVPAGVLRDMIRELDGEPQPHGIRLAIIGERLRR